MANNIGAETSPFWQFGNVKDFHLHPSFEGYSEPPVMKSLDNTDLNINKYINFSATDNFDSFDVIFSQVVTADCPENSIQELPAASVASVLWSDQPPNTLLHLAVT